MKPSVKNWIGTWWLAIVAFAVVIGLWWWWRSQVTLDDLTDPLAPGTYGDWFGSLNALFSGLAFAGLIITLKMQREELKQNTSALAAQKESLDAQVSALLTQADLMNRSARLSSVPILIGLVQQQIEGNKSRGLPGPITSLTSDQLRERLALIDVDILHQELQVEAATGQVEKQKASPYLQQVLDHREKMREELGRRVRLKQALIELLRLYDELQRLYDETAPASEPTAAA